MKVQLQANSEGHRYRPYTASHKLNVYVIIHIEPCCRQRRSSVTCTPFHNQLPCPKKLQDDACTARTAKKPILKVMPNNTRGGLHEDAMRPFKMIQTPRP
jgi:hypothetical protein